MTNKINILGAGQTSMLAGIMLANRGYQVEILDEKPMKQSHFALLRFGSKAIEEETGIKLEEVEIKKAIFYDGQIHNQSNIKFDNLYSQKVTGKIQRRSIGNLGVGKRYIPPADFFDQLEKKCEKLSIEFKQITELSKYHPSKFLRDFTGFAGEKTISTLPMPKMYKFVHPEEVKFDFEKVYVVEFTIDNCNVHQTIYYPSKSLNDPAYRISVVGNSIKCEISQETIKEFYDYDKEFKANNFKFQELLERLDTQIYTSFGISLPEEIVESAVQKCLFDGVDKVIHEQKFGKISPLNEQLRHSIIYNLTKQYGIYSLGRFSCWRQIMLDDVVQDVKRIENFLKLENLSGYQSAKNMAARLDTKK